MQQERSPRPTPAAAILPSINQPWTAFAVLAALTLPLMALPITHDAIWQIWLGQQMLAGAELYQDIIEVNPPLWFWIAEPLAAVGADPRLTVIGFFIAAIAVSLYLTPPRFRLALLPVLVVLPLQDFGQREHFTLIATVPYAFAIATRVGGTAPRHAIHIGLFAAVGLCLKPHFLLVPIALEAFAWRQRRVRPETVALGAIGAAYAVAIPLFAPAYLSDALPMVMRFYGSFGQGAAYILPVAAFFLAAGGAWLGRRQGSPETRSLLIAALAFFPAVVLQGKGFPYHSIPVRGFLCLAILLELRNRRDMIGDSLMVASALVCCMPFGLYHNAFRSEMERHLAGVEPGTSVIALTSNPSLAWPMVEGHRLDWRLHAFSAWQENAVVRRPELLPEVRAIYAADLADRPDILILGKRPVLGPVAHAIVPPAYLDCYSLRLSTRRMESYAKRC